MAAAAHFLRMWSQGQVTTGSGPSGPTASMTQGPFSQSWATASARNADEAWWMATPDGQKFLALRRQNGPQFVRMRGGGSCYPSAGYRIGRRC